MNSSIIRHIMVFLTVFALSSAGLKAGSLDEKLEALGFVDVAELNPSVKVQLMYGRSDNFTGRVLYDGLTRAWLHPEAAASVDRAQKALTELMPGYSLLVKDAGRPMSVQRRMFNAVKGTSKANYVANPAKGGGLHNYGMAVDITIVDPSGNEIDMGTEVDHLGPEANIWREEQLVSSGYMSENARQNRQLLRKLMTEAGFTPLRSEWWHFNRVSKAEAQRSYKRLDF